MISALSSGISRAALRRKGVFRLKAALNFYWERAISTPPMSVAWPIWRHIKAPRPLRNSRKFSITAGSWSAILLALSRTCDSAGLKHCRVTRPRRNPPIRISLRSGKMQTRTFRF